MSGYKPYPKYKDSGIGWLGLVPEQWDIKKLSYVASLQSGDQITAEDIDAVGQYPVYGGNGLRGYTSRFTHDGGYVLIGRQGALCGNINYAKDRFWASEHAVVVNPRENFNPIWIGELLREMNLNQYSVSAAQPGLSVEIISALKIPVPPFSEQKSIAAFLNRETSKLDLLIREQKELIALLQEKRQALISNAVTKGLNSKAKMKDSGVEWLGEVPEHWVFPPLSLRYSIELGKMLDEKKITGNFLVPYLRNVDVQWGRINFDSLPEMDIEESEYARYTIKNGDLLVCEGGEVGRAAIVDSCPGIFGFQKALHRIRALSQNESPEYLFYIFYWAASTGIFTIEGTSTIAHLTGEQLRSYRFPKPPIHEQKAIVAFIKSEAAKIDELITEAEETISLMHEHRASLISEAVTGKIDVRGLS